MVHNDLDGYLSGIDSEDTQTENLYKQFQNTASQKIATSREGSRKYALIVILTVYTLFTIFLAATLLVRYCKYGDQSALENLFELLKIGILPVLTLVLGHYFGSSEKT